MSMEVCVECCITSQDRAGRLLWDSLSKNCLTACTTNKSSHLEVSYSSEVPVLPAIPSDFCEHFLRMGDCEGLQGSCQLFHSPCCRFSLSQYSTFYWVLLWKPRSVGPRWCPLAGQIAISTLSVWFGGRADPPEPRLPQGWNFSGTLSQGSNSLVSVSVCCWVACASAVLY